MDELREPAEREARLEAGAKTVVFFEMSGCPYCVPYEMRFAEPAASRPDPGLSRRRWSEFVSVL